MQGYGEFIKPRWMNKMLSWQEPKGCYSDDRQSFLKLTGFVGPASAPSTKDREVSFQISYYIPTYLRLLADFQNK